MAATGGLKGGSTIKLIGWLILGLFLMALWTLFVAFLGMAFFAVTTFLFVDPSHTSAVWFGELWPVWVGLGCLLGLRHAVRQWRGSRQP